MTPAITLTITMTKNHPAKTVMQPSSGFRGSGVPGALRKFGVVGVWARDDLIEMTAGSGGVAQVPGFRGSGFRGRRADHTAGGTGVRTTSISQPVPERNTRRLTR